MPRKKRAGRRSHEDDEEEKKVYFEAAPSIPVAEEAEDDDDEEEEDPDEPTEIGTGEKIARGYVFTMIRCGFCAMLFVVFGIGLSAFGLAVTNAWQGG